MSPERARRFVLWVLAALAFVLAFRTIYVSDIWSQLLTGRWMVEQLAFPELDDFSFTRQGERYNAHEWLAYLLFHGAHTLGGGAGLLVVVGLCASAAVGLMASTALRREASPGVVLALGALTVWTLEARVLARPHVLAWPLLAFYARVLLADGRPLHDRLLRLVPLQLLWTNLHGSFVLGPLLAALPLVGLLTARLRRGATDELRRPLGAFGLVTLACLLSPDPAGTLLFPFRFSGQAQLGLVKEFEPTLTSAFFQGQTWVVGFSVLWAALLCVAAWRTLRERRDLVGAGVLVLSIWLALQANRWVQEAILLTFPIVASMASTRLVAPRLERILVAAGLVLVLGATAIWATHGYGVSPGRRVRAGAGLGRPYVADAVDALAARDLPRGRALCLYEDGGYLAYRLWPRVRVFIDARGDLYFGGVATEYDRLLTDPRVLPALVAHWSIDAIILPRPFERFATPLRSSGFELVHTDARYFVYATR